MIEKDFLRVVATVNIYWVLAVWQAIPRVVSYLICTT